MPNAICQIIKSRHGSVATCECANGFAGQLCQDIDECKAGNHSLHNCDLHANCINTIGSYSCVCKPGYYGRLV